MNYLDLDEDDKETIADILSNVEDYAEEGEDLKTQFVGYVKHGKHNVNTEFLNYLFDCYFAIDTLVRSNPAFNAVRFVEEKMEAFTENRLH